MKRYIITLFAILGIFPMIGVAKEAPFLRVGNWYEVEEPGRTIQGTSNTSQLTLKILQISADQWYLVLSQEITLPKDTTGQVIVREEKFWLNFAQATRAWPVGEIDLSYYKKIYAGGVKVEQVTGP
jgi:hypothetical protein